MVVVPIVGSVWNPRNVDIASRAENPPTTVNPISEVEKGGPIGASSRRMDRVVGGSKVERAANR